MREETNIYSVSLVSTWLVFTFTKVEVGKHDAKTVCPPAVPETFKGTPVFDRLNYL
jgi:hypothetical protein